MITESTRPSIGTPAASSEQVPFSRRVLKLEHPANVGPLIHVACWVGLLAFGLLVPAAANWYLAVPLIITLTLLNFSITLGVLHMHTHRPLFVSRRVNRVIDVLCCMPAALTAADMCEAHILNHQVTSEAFRQGALYPQLVPCRILLDRGVVGHRAARVRQPA